MIYANEARAIEVAIEMNAWHFTGTCRAVLTPHGWTVIRKAVW